MKVSIIIGLFGGSSLLLIYTRLGLWGDVIGPMSLVGDPFALLFLAVLIIAPFFPFAATVALVFAPLSRESRGILAFVLLIVGMVSAFFLVPFWAWLFR